MSDKKLITRDEANRENFRRSDLEHDEIFPSMLIDLTCLGLKRINIVTGDRNNHRSKEIDKKKTYLVGYSGRWHISTPEGNAREGWEFSVGHFSMGIGMLDFLFEIEGLPKYKSDPLGRISPYYDEDEEHDYEE